MPISPWDLPLLSGSSNHSNLQSFLDNITPSVPTRMPPRKKRDQSSNGFLQFSEKDKAEGFALRDLWDCYNEWSAYGVGVPIVLNNGDSVVQYYSPTLSALQIYTTKPCQPLFGQNDEKIWESEKQTELENGSCINDKGRDKILMPSSNSSCLSLDITWEDCATFQFGSGQTPDQCHYLYCQYNEICSPYIRITLKDKVDELAKTYQGLLKYRSIDLSPCSWVAIAWYPLYQIPTTTNVDELSACFLTYHALSSLSQGSKNGMLEKEKLEDKRKSRKRAISLPPFAMVTYKMFGGLWTKPGTSEQDSLVSRRTAACQWLKQLQFHHHDFSFFMSRQ